MRAEPVRDGAVAAELIAERAVIEPGQPFTVALRLTIDPGWHTYWLNPGDSGLPTKLVWTLPPGFQAGPLQFPYPERFVIENNGVKEVGFGYAGEAWHLIEITPPANLLAGSSVTFSGKATWLMCADVCIPGGVDLSLTLPVATGPAAPSPNAAAFARARANLPAAAPGWSLAARIEGGNAVFEITPPAGVALPEPAALSLYPEKAGTISLATDQSFRAEGGKLLLTVPAAADLAALPSPFAAVLISKAGFPSFEGRPAIRLGDAPPATAKTSTSASAAAPSPEAAPAGKAAPAGVAGAAASIEAAAAALTADDAPFGGGMLGYLIAAFVGGMILNVMPCVFPVISLKILSFVTHAGDERRKVLMHGVLYTLGILLFFVGLAAILIVVQAGWGAFQFQSPAFVMIMTAVIVVMSLSLFGVFEFGVKLTGAGGKLTQSSGYAGSFWSGALAVLLATPCTGPFLGASLGWAFTQPPAVNLAFFTLMGLGMALPYVLLTAFPKLLALMPRPGAWMETFKQVMGFPMLAAAVYLLWVLEGLIGDVGQAFFMGALVLLSLAVWAWGRYGGYAAPPKTRAGGLATAALALLAAVGLSLMASGKKPETTSADTRPIAAIIESHRAAGKHVFVDFTAKWCAICQTNKPAMYSAETKAAFAKYGVEFVVADWTNKSDDIFQYLKKHGRRSVPFYPLFPSDQSKGPLALPQNLTNGIILDHLQKLENVEANFPAVDRSVSALIEEFRGGNRPVLVSVTARWDGFSQKQSREFLRQTPIRDSLARRNVQVVELDGTGRSAWVFQFLREHGRKSVPFAAVFPANRNADVHPLPPLFWGAPDFDQLIENALRAGNGPENS